MKNNIKLVAAVFVCICLLITIQAGAREKKDSRKTDEVTFLTNLDCENCAKKIADKLPFEKGVKDMKVDVPKKTVWIQYQPSKTDKDKLKKAIEKIGYTAEEVKPNQ
jgi:copper chaperone CopZ